MSFGKKRQDRANSPERPKEVNLPLVSTPINIDKLDNYLADHPDKNFVSYLINGLTQGFDTGLKSFPSSSLECQNLLSSCLIMHVAWLEGNQKVAWQHGRSGRPTTHLKISPCIKTYFKFLQNDSKVNKIIDFIPKLFLFHDLSVIIT